MFTQAVKIAMPATSAGIDPPGGRMQNGMPEGEAPEGTSGEAGTGAPQT